MFRIKNKYLRMMVYPTIWLIVVFIITIVLHQGIDRFFIKQSLVETVDTRIITGLLTASSIIYGFSITFFLSRKKIPYVGVTIILIQTIFIGFSGTNLYELGLGLISSVEAIQIGVRSFFAIVFSNFVGIGFYLIDEVPDWDSDLK